MPILPLQAVDDAYGLYSGGSMTIGVINGTITATAGTEEDDSAYGIFAAGTLNTGAINLKSLLR